MIPAPMLENKVRKWTLPVFNGTPSSEPATLKRLLLPQGELAQIYDADEGIRYIAFTQLVPERVRGNHYHKVKEEFVYILQGKALLVIEDLQTNLRESTLLETGNLDFIPTGIAHALRPTEPGQAIEFSSARFDVADVHRFVLIQ